MQYRNKLAVYTWGHKELIEMEYPFPDKYAKTKDI